MFGFVMLGLVVLALLLDLRAIQKAKEEEEKRG